MVFEWDDEKERQNILKHGIDFRTASRVFLMKRESKTMTKSIVYQKIGISS